jgi:hypothetical protein
MLRKRDMRHMPRSNRTAQLSADQRMSRSRGFPRAAGLDPPVVATPKSSRSLRPCPAKEKPRCRWVLSASPPWAGEIIVVDCDLRCAPSTGAGHDPKEGLQQVLAGERNWKDVVGCDKASGAMFCRVALTSKDMFGSGAMESLIADLSEQYDLVVLDCAPIFAVLYPG